MESQKIIVALLGLIIGTNVFAAPITSSFKGSCSVRSRVVMEKLGDFDIKITPSNHFVTQEMRFTVPVENGRDVDMVDFVAHAIVERPDTGEEYTALKISSPDHTNEAGMINAKPGTILNSRYYIRAGEIDCSGIVD